MNHVIIADKKNNFIAIVMTPVVCVVVPAISGFILANSHDPVLTLLAFLAIAVSGLIFHVMALDWRDTKLSNTALSVALRERDDDVTLLKNDYEQRQDPDRIMSQQSSDHA